MHLIALKFFKSISEISVMILFLSLIFSLIPFSSIGKDSIVNILDSNRIIRYDLEEERVQGIDSLVYSSDFNFGSYINKGDYLIHVGGGIVYKIISDSLKRIDKSYDHKMQLGSNLFYISDTIFRFGGYGFFSARNFITYFDEGVQEWEILKTKSDVFPDGIYNSLSSEIGREIFIIGGLTINPNERSKTLPNKRIYSFDLDKRKWNLLGELDDRIFFQENSFQIENTLIYFDESTQLIDLKGNRITRLEKNIIHRKVHSSKIKPFVSDGFIYYIDDLSSDEISKISIEEFYSSPVLDNREFYTSIKQESILKMQYVVSIFLIITVISFGLYRLLRKKVLVIGRSYYFFFSKLTFDKEEKDLLMMFCNELRKNGVSTLSNKDVLKIVDHKQLDEGTVTRKKNDLIRGLNGKIKMILGIQVDPISSKRSDSDKRYTSYTFNPVFLRILK